MSVPVIKLKNVNKIYPGVHALKDVDFEIHPGEVHCLVGGNGSGKSTMIKIISGVETAEKGSEIEINGIMSHNHTAKQAFDNGIQVIYQDMALFPNLTIRENIAFRNHFGKKHPFVSWKELDRTAKEAMALIGMDFDLDQKVSKLSIAQQQLVEIIRSLTGSLSLLILDEPTASLTRKEVNALFSVIGKLKSKGVAILFVSHKLNEVFEIAESVTIVRDGDKIGQYNPEELNHDKLVYLMSGQNEIHEIPARIDENAKLLLQIRNLSKTNNYKDINLTLQKGEILGITGLLGSGRTELALSIFGMNKPDSGEIIIDGEKTNFSSNRDALKKGIGYVPENRREEGLIYDQSIEDNISITTLYHNLNHLGLINDNALDEAALKWETDLSIKIPRLDAPIQTLSGGNQQKVVLAKWLALNPKILILDEPTIGIDVIAKNSIHSLMKKLAASGMGVIIISDEVQEVIHNCHRVLVMDSGKIVYEFDPDDVNEEELLKKYNLA